MTNVAIPTIQHSLHLSTAGLEWVVSGYFLAFAALLLAAGKLADVYGRRRLFFTGLTLFTLASLGAGGRQRRGPDWHAAAAGHRRRAAGADHPGDHRGDL